MRAEEISGDPLRFFVSIVERQEQAPGRCTLSQMTTSPNDLSISELSLHGDQTLKPFSLLASTEPELHKEEPVAQEPPRHSAKAREEKLQSDIFILKKLNASLELFNEALQDTGSTNQVLLHFIYNLHLSYHRFLVPCCSA